MQKAYVPVLCNKVHKMLSHLSFIIVWNLNYVVKKSQ